MQLRWKSPAGLTSVRAASATPTMRAQCSPSTRSLWQQVRLRQSHHSRFAVSCTIHDPLCFLAVLILFLHSYKPMQEDASSTTIHTSSPPSGRVRKPRHHPKKAPVSEHGPRWLRLHTQTSNPFAISSVQYEIYGTIFCLGEPMA